MNSTIKSVVSAVVVIVVTVGAWFGHEISTDDLTAGLTLLASLLAAVYAIWKNHNFTSAALQAQGLLVALKADANEDELKEVAEAHNTDNSGE